MRNDKIISTTGKKKEYLPGVGTRGIPLFSAERRENLLKVKRFAIIAD